MQISLDLPQRRILTVSDLTSLIKSDLEESFYDIWIEGEISNLRIPASGHSYLTLKDEASQIKAVLFKSSARNIKFELKDGIHIICHGRLTVYEPRGEYQIVIDLVEPRGIGALQLAFEQLKEKLAKEGLFDPERKRPIPLLPRKNRDYYLFDRRCNQGYAEYNQPQICQCAYNNKPCACSGRGELALR